MIGCTENAMIRFMHLNESLNEEQVEVDHLEVKASGKKSPKNAPGLMIRWELIVTSLGILSLGSLVVIVVLVATKGSDLLSAVALLLAVLSFAAQLIVTGVQSASARKNHEDLSALSHKTDVSLTTINTRVKELVALQSGNYDKLLQTVIDRMADPEKLVQMMGDAGIRGGREEETGPEDTEGNEHDVSSMTEAEIRLMAERLRDELSREAKAAIENAARVAMAGPSEHARNVREEAMYREALIRLSTLSKASLEEFLPRLMSIPLTVMHRGEGDPPEWVIEARRAGLIRPEPSRESGGPRRLWRLTPMGRAAREAISLPRSTLGSNIWRLSRKYREKYREIVSGIGKLEGPDSGSVRGPGTE